MSSFSATNQERPYKQLLHNYWGLDDEICTIPLKNISLLNPEKLFQDTVEPWYNEGPREWQNLFVIMRFHYIVYPGFFSILYFTITWVNKIIHYNKDSVVIHLIYNLHSLSKICMPHWSHDLPLPSDIKVMECINDNNTKTVPCSNGFDFEIFRSSALCSIENFSFIIQ